MEQLDDNRARALGHLQRRRDVTPLFAGREEDGLELEMVPLVGVVVEQEADGGSLAVTGGHAPGTVPAAHGHSRGVIGPEDLLSPAASILFLGGREHHIGLARMAAVRADTELAAGAEVHRSPALRPARVIEPLEAGIGEEVVLSAGQEGRPCQERGNQNEGSQSTGHGLGLLLDRVAAPFTSRRSFGSLAGEVGRPARVAGTV